MDLLEWPQTANKHLCGVFAVVMVCRGYRSPGMHTHMDIAVLSKRIGKGKRFFSDELSYIPFLPYRCLFNEFETNSSWGITLCMFHSACGGAPPIAMLW